MNEAKSFRREVDSEVREVQKMERRERREERMALMSAVALFVSILAGPVVVVVLVRSPSVRCQMASWRMLSPN